LSWLTILKKRAGLRAAYDNLDVRTVANYGDADRARLMGDAGIIRNRLKIEAAIHNAGVFLNLRESHGFFADWLASQHPKSKEDWVRLFKKTLRFTEGEITGEFLMSIGYLPGSRVPGARSHSTTDSSVDTDNFRGIVAEALPGDHRDEHTWTARHFSPP
jgi:DNA-3-methyladenine glycosylase I